MPLIAAAFIAHAAGLLFGFGGVSLSGVRVDAAMTTSSAWFSTVACDQQRRRSLVYEEPYPDHLLVHVRH